MQHCTRRLVGSALPASDSPCSASEVPGCGVNFCWYDAMELPCFIGPWCELGEIYTGNMETELSQCDNTNSSLYM